ncbi:putative endoplasmic reticulum-Golgi intermediate compartment protein 3 [Apostichopus japonicus]|uniref:Putative endoplasmic reticulum-Golgi intermediate compartment protein 3 n=1 Tax=Stichopus japonicus TaxID=307972 RepID=A0A2G8JYU4_STIJA|nr:putative endoplasmic reticulum-Golgi intermediate compartment protein 3 [Apostichopus japonicus]
MYEICGKQTSLILNFKDFSSHMTIVSGLFMFILFVSELNFYLSKEVIPELYVDNTRNEKLKINIDMIFPRMPCAFLSVDAMDISGEHQLDVEANLFKQRLDQNGQKVEDTAEETQIGDETEGDEDAIQKQQKYCYNYLHSETSEILLRLPAFRNSRNTETAETLLQLPAFRNSRNSYDYDYLHSETSEIVTITCIQKQQKYCYDYLHSETAEILLRLPAFRNSRNTVTITCIQKHQKYCYDYLHSETSEIVMIICIQKQQKYCYDYLHSETAEILLRLPAFRNSRIVTITCIQKQQKYC